MPDAKPRDKRVLQEDYGMGSSLYVVCTHGKYPDKYQVSDLDHIMDWGTYSDTESEIIYFTREGIKRLAEFAGYEVSDGGV